MNILKILSFLVVMSPDMLVVPRRGPPRLDWPHATDEDRCLAEGGRWAEAIVGCEIQHTCVRP